MAVPHSMASAGGRTPPVAASTLPSGSLPSGESAFTAASDAVDSMKRFCVEPSPENYEVWYSYHRRADVDLVRTIDILTSNHQAFDDRRMSELRERFNGSGRSVSEAATLIQEALRHVVSALGDMGAENDAFASRLDKASQEFQHGEGRGKGLDQYIARLRSVVQALAAETRSIADENRKLGDELSTTSARMQKLEEDLEGVQKEARTDALTGLYNRRAFEEDLRQSAIDAMETGAPLSLIMVDIDFFKKLNDTHGHQTGDEVIRLVGRVLRDSLRDFDRPSRYGGEEFAILLPSAAISDGVTVAERIRSRVASRNIVRRTTGETVGTVTLSLGVAEYLPGEPIAALVRRADEALYAAKTAGRNRVVSAAQ